MWWSHISQTLAIISHGCRFHAYLKWFCATINILYWHSLRIHAALHRVWSQTSGAVVSDRRPMSQHICGLEAQDVHIVLATCWVRLDWIEQCFMSPPTQYRLYGRQFLQWQFGSKDPTNSIKVLKERATKEKSNNGNNIIHIYIDNDTHYKDTTHITHNKSPSLH